ncbi:MAG: DUF1634 domain-containing protein [Gemmatimonadaceae bacterium]
MTDPTRDHGPQGSRPQGPAPWTDEQVEMFVGNLLRVGVIVAASVAVIGGVLYLARYGSTVAQYHVFRGEPEELRSVRAVVRDAFHLRGRSVVQLGLLLLIATPIARVALSLLAFLRQGDRTYVAITAIVLALLLYGLTGASA